MSFDLWFFIAAFTLAAIVPGPVQAALVANVLARPNASIAPFIAGIVFGNSIWLGAAILGLSAVAIHFATLFVVVTWLGVLYLVFVAWKIWTSNPQAPEAIANHLRKPRGPGLLAGAALTIGNPKTVVFFSAVLPQAFELQRLSLIEVQAILALGLTIDVSVQAGYALAATRVRAFLSSPQQVRYINRIAAAMMLGSAAVIASLRVTPTVLTGPAQTFASVSPSTADVSALPPPVVSFLAGGLGRAATDAPSENQFFAQLVGVWRCALRLDDGSRAFPSIWVFKHSVGGFAVEHLYFQAKDDLVPPLRGLGRDLQSKAMTLYDPAAGKWRFLGASNVAGSGLGEATQTMSGILREGALAFERDASNREVFANVTAQSFAWRKEASGDSGLSWEVTVLIECRKR